MRYAYLIQSHLKGSPCPFLAYTLLGLLKPLKSRL